MTKRELIDALDGYDDESEVRIRVGHPHGYIEDLDYSLVHHLGDSPILYADLENLDGRVFYNNLKP